MDRPPPPRGAAAMLRVPATLRARLAAPTPPITVHPKTEPEHRPAAEAIHLDPFGVVWVVRHY